MTEMTEQEWASVQEALCVGDLQACINRLLLSRAPVQISDKNRRIIEQAWDDGDGNTVRLVETDDPPWFVGYYDDYKVCDGVEYNGVLYVIAPLSGGGLVSVIVGEALIQNETGVAFNSDAEAKAYIQGRIAS